ncbi:MAG: hypothetical protein ACHP91_15870, partial [Burkholderiales bacterium]
MARTLLKPHAAMFATLLRFLDPACSAGAGAVAFLLYPPATASTEHYVVLIAASTIAIAVVFPAFRLYDTYRGASVASELRDIALAWLLLAAIVVAMLFVTKTGDTFSRVWMA